MTCSTILRRATNESSRLAEELTVIHNDNDNSGGDNEMAEQIEELTLAEKLAKEGPYHTLERLWYGKAERYTSLRLRMYHYLKNGNKIENFSYEDYTEEEILSMYNEMKKLALRKESKHTHMKPWFQ